MKGFQITFLTHQDKRHRGKPLADSLRFPDLVTLGAAGSRAIARRIP